jgi:hypothetical protein
LRRWKRDGRRPDLSASISTHFFTTSAGFCEKVFMEFSLHSDPVSIGSASGRFLLLCVASGPHARRNRRVNPRRIMTLQGL